MTFDHNTYTQQVRKILGNFKAQYQPEDPAFQHALIQVLGECFHVQPCDQEALVASKVILDELFGYSVSGFLKNHVSDPVVEQKCMSELLYGLYYGGIAYKKYKNNFEYLLIQILAEKMSGATFLRGYSFDKTVRLLAFLYKNPREGTFLLEKCFDKRFEQLIFWCKRNYYDVDLFSRLVDSEEQFTEEKFAKIVARLEQDAQDKTHELHTNFQELCSKTLALVEDMYKGLMQVVQDPDGVKKQYEALKKPLEAYLSRRITLDDFTKFTRQFGLKGYPCIAQGSSLESTSVVEKVNGFLRFVSGSTSAALSAPDLFTMMLSYILAIIAHCDATVYSPQKYTEGLKYFTISIPTCAKELEREFALSSIVQANCQTTVVVFDQSQEALFEKNRRYIQSLGAKIVHVSKNEAIELAQKIGVKKLVATMPDGSFGYGGARNCQFLLTGVIRAAYDMGKKTMREILAVSAEELSKLFTRRVLENKEGHSLFLVDDDMYIRDSHLLSAALFANENRAERIGCEGYQLGRASKYNLQYWDLLTLLSAPENVVMFPLWLDSETKAGLSAYVLKSRICLNLPQGNEEAHFLEAICGHFFLQPVYHLCGSRYPDKEIPTSFFVGLDSYAEKAISYVFFLYVTRYLIAPNRRSTAIGLPWNDDGLSASFTSLLEGFTFIADSNTQSELKTRFWAKVRGLFCDELDEYGPFLECIRSLKALDVDLVVATFAQSKKVTKHEEASLKRLGDVYKKNQQDIKLFWKFGKALGEAKQPEQELDSIKNMIEKEAGCPLVNYPITDGFYHTAVSVGKAEFCAIIQQLISK